MTRKIMVIALLIYAASAKIQAQSIAILFTNGTTNEYPLLQVSKITFSETDMLLHKTDNTVLTWAISDIRKYYYGVFTEHTESSNKFEQLDVLVSPNPSNGEFKINYKVESDGEIDISICTIDGRFLETILSARKNKGSYTFNWQRSNLPSGTYILRVQNADKFAVNKIIIKK